MICEKKKITFFVSSLAGGGAEGVCVNIANGLADINWDVTLVVLHTKKSVLQDKLSSRVNYVVLDVSNARYSFKALYTYLKNNNVNKLVVFNYELAVILILIRKLSFLNYKIISRNINSMTQKKKHYEKCWRSRALYWLLFKVYKESDHIINQCEEMRRDLLSVFPELKAKSSVIYNPINREIEKNLSEIPNPNVSGENYLLCVGRLEKQKAFHYALEAFSLICNDYPGLVLKVVGVGSLEVFLKGFAAELEISDRVEFVGFQKDIIPYYKNSRGTLLTSLYEGFPNVLVESIALGTPVVSFDCMSGPNEIIISGQNGYLSNYLDVKDMSDKIRILLDKSLSRNEVAQTSLRFSSEQILSSWAEVISNE